MVASMSSGREKAVDSGKQHMMTCRNTKVQGCRYRRDCERVKRQRDYIQDKERVEPEQLTCQVWFLFGDQVINTRFNLNARFICRLCRAAANVAWV